MKKAIFIISLVFAVHTSFAGRFYSPDYGRWLNRDPIGVNGGINIYNSVSNNMVNGFTGGFSYSGGMNSFIVLQINTGLDPLGLKVDVLAISGENGKKDTAVHLAEKSYELSRKGLTKVKTFVEGLSDITFLKAVRAGSVFWEGKKFWHNRFSARADYLKLINHELKSTFKVIVKNPTTQDVQKALKELTANPSGSFTSGFYSSDNGPRPKITTNDSKVFIIHGTLSQNVSIGGNFVPRVDIIDGASPAHKFFLASCFSNRHRKKEIVDFFNRTRNSVEPELSKYYDAKKIIKDGEECIIIKAQEIRPVITIKNTTEIDPSNRELFDRTIITDQKTIQPTN